MKAGAVGTSLPVVGSVKTWAGRRGPRLGVQAGRARDVPVPGGQPVQQRLGRGDGLGRGERAVAGAGHEDLPQQVAVTVTVDHALVGLLVLGDDQAVSGGVHAEDGDRDVAVEGDVLGQVGDGRGLRADPGGAVQRQQVLGQAEPGGLVQRRHLLQVDRLGQVGEVVHAGVPGHVAARPGLELGPEGQHEREGDLGVPEELVLLLGDVVGRRGFGRQRGEPAAGVAERGDQGQAGPAGRGLLGRSHRLLAGGQVSRGVGDVDDLDTRGDQLLERERCVERGVPGRDTAGQHAAHGQRGVEQVRVILDQPGGDDAAQGVPPRDRGARLAVGRIEGVQRVDLVRQRLLDGPAGRGVGRSRQGIAVSRAGRRR